jgi:predicted nuclease of restriction endonuclease-like (RecB) superfamily
MTTRKAPAKSKSTLVPVKGLPAEPLQSSFAEVVHLIEQARQRAYQAVNTQLMELYWTVGEYVSHKIEADGWGRGTVKALSEYIQRRQPGIGGFSPQNIWRMRQFFETYRGEPELSPLVRELPWSANLHILTRAKRPEEREFYLRMATNNRWDVREVARQIDGALFERATLNPPKLSTALRELHPESGVLFQIRPCSRPSSTSIISWRNTRSPRRTGRNRRENVHDRRLQTVFETMWRRDCVAWAAAPLTSVCQKGIAEWSLMWDELVTACSTPLNSRRIDRFCLMWYTLLGVKHLAWAG